MNKIFQILLVAYLAVHFSDSREAGLREPSAKENLMATGDNEPAAEPGRSRVTRPYYQKNIFETTDKLRLPVEMMVN